MQSFERYKSNCLCESTSVLVILHKNRWGLFNLRENSIASVLVGLKGTSQVVSHSDIFSRSVLSWPAAVKVSSTTIKIQVSSVNGRIFEPISVKMSLM